MGDLLLVRLLLAVAGLSARAKPWSRWGTVRALHGLRLILSPGVLSCQPSSSVEPGSLRGCLRRPCCLARTTSTRRTARHDRNAKVIKLLLLNIRIEFEHVQDGLRVSDLVLLGNGRRGQKSRPLLRKTLIGSESEVENPDTMIGRLQ